MVAASPKIRAFSWKKVEFAESIGIGQNHFLRRQGGDWGPIIRSDLSLPPSYDSIPPSGSANFVPR